MLIFYFNYYSVYRFLDKLGMTDTNQSVGIRPFGRRRDNNERCANRLNEEIYVKMSVFL